jgi:4-aminobutyrate---pyruvate transaminase
VATEETLKTMPALNSASARDLAYMLHGNVNLRAHENRGPTLISRGAGIYVYDENGKEYIEGIGGAWCIALGLGEERLAKAAADQMKTLSYYHTFFHKTHDPAISLAEKLVSMTPPRLTRAFFANSGSEANDTVMKFVWFYNNARGRRSKKKIISRLKAYHGIGIGSGSLTGLPLNHSDFDLPIANVLHTSCPHYYRFAHPHETEEQFAGRMAKDLEDLILREGPETVAAFIGEPVMGAGGVMVPPKTYWSKVQAVCKKYDVLLIADEVITGFGRTGRMFACELYDIDPDILVLSKQMTSAYIPMSAVLVTDDLYQVIADNSARLGTLGHGFTTSGHPVASAVALENIRILEERNLIEHVQEVARVFLKELRNLEEHPLVGEVRGVGLLGAVEFVADRATRKSFEPAGKLGAYIFERAHHYGLIVRCIQDTIAFCPPLIIDAAQIREMLVRFGRTLKDADVWARENVH